MKTYNRGQLLRLAKAGRLTLTDSYHFDDMLGSERQQGTSMPVAMKPEDWKDRAEGVCYLTEFDFKTKSGCAWLNVNGTVTMVVHSNCNYTFNISTQA